MGLGDAIQAARGLFTQTLALTPTQTLGPGFRSIRDNDLLMRNDSFIRPWVK